MAGMFDDPASFGLGAPVGATKSGTAPQQPAALPSMFHPDQFGLGAPIAEPAQPTQAPTPQMVWPEASGIPQADVPEPMQRIAAAVGGGWREAPGFLTPQAREAANQNPIGRFITNPLMDIAGAALIRLPAAITAGTSQAAAEVGGPAAGRDMNALLQVAPAAGIGAPRVTLPRAEPVPLAAETARAADRISGKARLKDLLGAIERADQPEEPASLSAAAASPGEATMTPKQIEAYRKTAEGQMLLETQQPGVSDPNVYIPGIHPNLAEIEQTVKTAREMKTLQTMDPEARQMAEEVADYHNNLRRQHFESVAGSPVDVANAEADLAEWDKNTLGGIWRNAGEASIAPIEAAGDAIKASKDWHRSLVRNAVNSVLNELRDENGNPITDPQQLHGVREHIGDMLNEMDPGGAPKYKRAMAALIQMRDAIDAAIEPAAPGFEAWKNEHSARMRPIEAMRVLQGHEAGLYDSQGVMQPARVYRMMRETVDSRMAPGVNPYQSITPEQMGQLQLLLKDTRRVAAAKRLSMAPGSDTTQNAIGIMREALRSRAGEMALHTVGAAALGGWGPLVTGPLRAGMEAVTAGKAARERAARFQEMLRPPVTLRNPALPP